VYSSHLTHFYDKVLGAPIQVDLAEGGGPFWNGEVVYYCEVDGEHEKKTFTARLTYGTFLRARKSLS
jgi:hypothetical protein